MTGVYELTGEFTVTFQLRHAALEAEWGPRLPTTEEFFALLQSYRGARELFLKSLGFHVVVIER